MTSTQTLRAAPAPDGIGADIYDRMAREGSRTGAPPGFPKLPDVPLGRYTEPALFELEQEVFRRSWLFVGHESEFDGHGSYRLLDIPLAPVIVVRGNNGELRGYFNAGRHRGAPGAISTIRVDAWSGLVFANVDAAAPPLREVIDPVARRFSDVLSGPLRLVDTRHYDIRCNWKVVMEAFLEVYHLKTVHATTAAQFGRSTSAVFGLHPHGVSTMFFPYTDDVADAESGSIIHQVMFPSDLPSPPAVPEIYRTTNVLFAVFPNLVAPLSPQGFPVVQAWPVALDRTRFDVRWYGLDWGDGPRPAGWDVKFAAWDLVLDEDMRNLEPIQHSLECAAHKGIPLGYQERAIWHLHATIDRCVGSQRITDELRVPDLLADLIEP